MAELDARYNRREAVEKRLDLMVARAGLALPPDHPAYARLCRLAPAVRVEAARIDAARNFGDYRAGWPQAPTSVPPEAVPHPSGGVRPTPPPVAAAHIRATASLFFIATSQVSHSDIATTTSAAPLLSAA